MGIQGLLPALKSITITTHVQEYAGMKVAVDTYSWLHKGAISCSKDLCEGQPTTRYIEYCMHRVNLLRHYGVKPLLVFDGGVLPMKAEQEAKRSRSRKEHLERAHQHEASGNRAAAYESYQKAVDITPLVAYRLIEVLRQENVEFIVAPYEADAQMAYLSLKGLVDVIITEDSDLIAYGCPRVLFKMDKFGEGVEIQYSDLVRNKDLNFSSFTKQMVLEMCVFSGCDYLPSLQGMGVKKAHNLIRRFRSYQKIIKHLRFSGNVISKQYEEGFEKAILTFCHQRVYDPVSKDMVFLAQLPQDIEIDLAFLGPLLSQSLIRSIAEGLIDPITHVPFQVLSPAPSLQEEFCPAVQNSSTKLTRKERKQLDLPAQKNVLTNYFISKSEASIQQFKAPRNTSGSQEAYHTAIDFSAQDFAISYFPSASSPLTPNTLTPPDEGDGDDDLFCVPVTPDMMLDSNLETNVDMEFELRNSKKMCIRRDNYDNEVDSSLEKPSFSKSASSKKSSNVIVRSQYFRGKVEVDEEDEEDEECENDENAFCGSGWSATPTPLKEVQPRKRSEDIPFIDKFPIPKFSSKLIGEERESLSANVDHVKAYASIAQASMDKFSSIISSFKCPPSKSAGARVSGLRAPFKCNIRR